MTEDMPRILVVICAGGGDAETLPGVVQGTMAAGFTPLVVDDGEAAAPTPADLPCRSLRLTGSHGYGAAVLAGAGHAGRLGYDAIVTMAGDGRHDPADIGRLAAEAGRLAGPGLVVGSAEDNMPPDFWVRLECGREIPDPRSQFRLYPVRELLALRLDGSSRNFAIESLVRLAWAGLPVVPVAVAAGSPAGQEAGSAANLRHRLNLVLLHGRLVARRLLPLPHLRFKAEESLHKKVVETIWQNPFKVLGKACGEHASPLWLAIAVWLGIFLGALPLLSIHTVTILYVAHRLHVNKVVAVAASQLCMPPVVPVLCIQVGYALRKGALLLDFSWQKWLLEIHERFWEWLIGSLLLGPVLGFIGAGLMYWMVVRLQKKTRSQAA